MVIPRIFSHQDRPGDEIASAPIPRVLCCPLCCFINLGDGYVTAVDPEVWVRTHHLPWRWKKSRGGIYAYWKKHTQRGTKIIYMHRLIAKPVPPYQVHHKNGLTLDNRRENLQVISRHDHEQITKMNRISKKLSA